jgi:hypothetical protein
MGGESTGSGPRGTTGMAHLEEELTAHLERANELGRLVKRANDEVEEQLRRTQEIADTLRGVADDQ